MKRPAIVLATALLLIAALVPATALAHHDAPVDDNPPVVDDTPVNDGQDPPTQTPDQGGEEPTQEPVQEPRDSGTDTSTPDSSTPPDSSCSGSSCSKPDDPPCTKDCGGDPPCTENCTEEPPCTIGCDGDPVIPDDDPCLVDLNACGGDEEIVGGEGVGPNVATLGAGRALPYTGIGDALLPLLVGALALIAGIVAYRYASVREALISARESARRYRQERRSSGYANAIDNIEADRQARAFWEGRHSAA